MTSQSSSANVRVDTLQGLEDLTLRVKKAQEIYASFNQAQVDFIFKQAAIAANNARLPLAKQAVAETGMGVIEDKVIKNHFASEYIYNKYKQAKTCGVIYADAHYGIQKVAEPIGVIAGIVPTTNPTATESEVNPPKEEDKKIKLGSAGSNQGAKEGGWANCCQK